jgi:hypothetical protein
MHFRLPRLLTIALAAVGLGLTAQPAEGAFIQGGPGISPSTEGIGSFTGSLEVDFVSATEAKLTISLTNTSATTGYLTAFVFNNPGGYAISLSSSTSASFDTFLNGNNAVNGSPYGLFDFGVTTQGGFQGGGAPQNGLAVGEDATWVFSVTGTGAGALTDINFLSTLSADEPGGGSGGGNQAFVTRFRGFPDEGSDKVVGTGNPNIIIETPAPAGLILLASGAPVLLLRRVLRRKLSAA